MDKVEIDGWMGNDVGLNDAVHGCLHATDFRV